MKVAEIKKKAKDLGITCGKMKKTELILSIQRAEGNELCYGSSGGSALIMIAASSKTL